MVVFSQPRHPHDEESPLSEKWQIRRVGYTHPDAVALVERVQKIYVERYGSPDADEPDPSVFEAPHGAFYVGYQERTPVATGAWRASGLERLGADRVAEIKRMFVVPEAQRQGLARRMLAHLEETAAAAGYQALVLSTGPLQPEAIALYRSSGYRPVPPFGYFADHPEVVCLGKLLHPSPRGH